MFSKTDRTLMAMMFRRGMVTEISGTYTENHIEYSWGIRFHPVDIFRAESYFTGTLSHWYEDFTGDTLDEVLDQIEACCNDMHAVRKRIRHRRAVMS